MATPIRGETRPIPIKAGLIETQNNYHGVVDYLDTSIKIRSSIRGIMPEPCADI